MLNESQTQSAEVTKSLSDLEVLAVEGLSINVNMKGSVRQADCSNLCLKKVEKQTIVTGHAD